MQPYINKLNSLLHRSFGFPHGATELFDFLYLGSEDEATDLKLLETLGITHVINCASGYVSTGKEFYGDSIQTYVEFDAEDDDCYNIMQHFDETFKAIEDARAKGGKALIHCIMGVNRSGALAVAYAMVYKQWGPITATKYVKDARKRLLSNDAFIQQIVVFAHDRQLLELDRDEIVK